jgi:peptide methionine sulfoxide reductase msrA/msrB
MRTIALITLFLLSAVLTAALVRGSIRSSQPETQKMNTTKPTDPSAPTYSKAGYDLTPLTQARIDELAKKLTPEEAQVILSKGTERAFCGNLVDNHKDGVYVCRLCGLPLFDSSAKFDSGSGWPSFFQPFAPGHVHEETDSSHGMTRTEITCARCGGHLGHVFNDGPRPTGLRFCLNSASLTFFEKGQTLPPESSPILTETAYFAGGCFWGVEDRFQQIPGVIDAVSGYQGGTTKNPTYEQVCRGDTGHAETVKVVFDPARVSYPTLLAYFFKFHDPTQLNRQGPDHGTQYRSAIFTTSDAQTQAAAAFIAAQSTTDRFKGRKIATQVTPITPTTPAPFHEAESYHQDYDAKHGTTCPLPEL